MRRRLIGYLIGPYRATEQKTVEQHRAEAREEMERLNFLFAPNAFVFAPHLMTEPIQYLPTVDDQDWLDATMSVMLGFDFAVVMPTSEHSSGSMKEMAVMVALKRPIFDSHSHALEYFIQHESHIAEQCAGSYGDEHLKVCRCDETETINRVLSNWETE